MKTLAFGLLWGFVLAAAAYDSWFAWNYRHVLDAWELNPLARWMADGVGLPGVLAWKFMGLAFAATVAGYCLYLRRRVGWLLTFTVVGAYGLLSLHYLLCDHAPDYEQRALLALAPLRAPAR